MLLTGAEIICECLIEQGVDAVFGYPGGAALNTYDALYKYSDRIKHILTAHEQGASHAADGYARATGKPGVVIADESQFFSPEQIDQLRELVDITDTAVLCFGLRTDFRTKLFPGSARLMEIADSIEEIKTMCACGKKATVNARLDEEGNIVTEGRQIELGGNDRYEPMCHRCYSERLITPSMIDVANLIAVGG